MGLKYFEVFRGLGSRFFYDYSVEITLSKDSVLANLRDFTEVSLQFISVIFFYLTAILEGHVSSNNS